LMVHVCNPATWVAQAGGLWFWGQPGKVSEILSQNNKIKTKGLGVQFKWYSTCHICMYDALGLIPSTEKKKKTSNRKYMDSMWIVVEIYCQSKVDSLRLLEANLSSASQFSRGRR
jgi:hypothetical protein